MANIPDFSVHTDPAILQAFQNAQAQKQKAQQQQLENNSQKFQQTLDTINAVSGAVGHIVQGAAKQQQENLINSATSLLAQPAPSQTVSEMVPGTTELGPEAPQQTIPNPSYNADIAQRNQAKMKLATALAPKETGEALAKQLYSTPKASDTPNYQSKQIMVDGQPKEALFNPDPNSKTPFLDAVTKQPITGKIEPYSANTPSDVTDDDRKRLTPLAKAVIEGRALPSALVNARGNDKVKLSQIAAELDPQFDLSLAPQRIATRKDFSAGGQSGRALTSLNTVIGHLDTLDQKIEALDNNQIVKANQLGNYLKTQTGDPKTTGFNAAKALVISEMGKIAQGAGVVSNEERSQFEQSLNSSQSKDQAHEAINTFMDLIKSRTDALKSNWEQSMSGVTPPVPFINAKSKEKLIKHGFDPVTLERKQQEPTNEVDSLAKVLGLKKKAK